EYRANQGCRYLLHHLFSLNLGYLTSVSIASLARLIRAAARLGEMWPESRLVDFRRVSHAIALFSKGKSDTRTDGMLSSTQSRSFLGPFRTNTVEEVESVERADHSNERSPIRKQVWGA